jgi:hypothetical protein
MRSSKLEDDLVQILRNERVTIDSLLNLTKAELRSIGIPLGPAILAFAIQKLKEPMVRFVRNC